MSDQENSQVKIFFDSNKFPWERQYTDGKGNWYDKDELDYDESENSFYLVNLEGIKSSLILDSDIMSNVMTELDLDEYNQHKFDHIDIASDSRDFLSLTSEINLSQLPIKKYQYKTKTYPWNTLFYSVHEKKFYDPNTGELYDTIKGNGEFYVCYNPKGKKGPYEPKQKNLWSARFLDQNIKSIEYINETITYTVYIFETYAQVKNIIVV